MFKSTMSLPPALTTPPKKEGEEREERILEALKERGPLTTPELSELVHSLYRGPVHSHMVRLLKRKVVTRSYVHETRWKWGKKTRTKVTLWALA